MWDSVVMRLLGIDLGDKRTGLALADQQLDVVSPLKTIEVPLARGGELIERIRGTIEAHGAGEIVIGLPLNMDGSEGPQAAKIRAFAQLLGEGAPGVPIHLHDERLTSDEADALMAQSGLTHKQKKARRDALAAVVILRSYLASIGP